MKIRLGGATIIVVASMGLALADPADEPSVGITCDHDAKVIRLNYLWSDFPGFELPEAKEWVNSSALVSIEDRDTERPRWKAKPPSTHRCQISGKHYVVLVEPHIWNPNMQGRCGAGISAAVSVKQGNNIVVRKTPFHADCHSGDIISELVFNTGTGQIIIRMADGGEHELRPNPTVETDARKSGARSSP